MTRRKIKFKVNKHNRIQRDYSKGKGDLLYQVFQCLNPDCEELITIETNKIFKNGIIKRDLDLVCPHCNYEYEYDGTEKFYDYSLDVKDDLDDEDVIIWDTIETGEFKVRHKDYLQKSKQYKYCIICSTLQPIENFSRHNSRNSKRQGECITCKNMYNSFKNATRTQEQFAESSQKRRLYSELAGNNKINYKRIREKFNNECFNCGKDLSNPNTISNLDHTLPAMYLWPLDTENATLLCSDCNQNKSGLWPGEYYSTSKLGSLSIYTGIDYKLLSGPPIYNPDALEKLRDKKIVESILTNYSKHIDEIIKIRNRILNDTGFDFFSSTHIISDTIIERANNSLINRK